MEADHRGLLLPPPPIFFKIIPSLLHLLTARPPGAGGVSSASGKEQIMPEGQKEEVSSDNQNLTTLWRMMWAAGRKGAEREWRKRSGRQTLGWILCLGLADFNLSFLWKCWAFCSSLFRSLAQQGNQFMGAWGEVEEKFSPVKISEPSASLVPPKTFYAFEKHSGISPRGRLFLVAHLDTKFWFNNYWNCPEGKNVACENENSQGHIYLSILHRLKRDLLQSLLGY